VSRPMYSIEELTECARAPGCVGVAVVCGTRIVRAVSAPNTGTILWSVDGRPQSETYVADLLARDWADTTIADEQQD
jgi:hypothetical protein